MQEKNQKTQTIREDFVRKNLAFAIFKKTIQHFALFPKLIKEMPIFKTQFSQNRVKPYSGVFKELVVTF